MLWRWSHDYSRFAQFPAVAQVSCIIAGWGLGPYPYLVVPDVTFAASAGPTSTLRFLLWALGLGALVLFPSFAWLFRVFKPSRRPRSQP